MNKFESLKKILNENGMNATPQRMAILDFFQNDRSHPDVDSVYINLSDKIGGLSKTTVYRIVEEFCQKGLIRHFSSDGTRRRYDGNPSHHHHLICTECGEVRDIEIPKSDVPKLSRSVLDGFTVGQPTISYFGQCADCS